MEAVYSTAFDHIQHGEDKNREKQPETDLAKRLGSGRSAVRHKRQPDSTPQSGQHDDMGNNNSEYIDVFDVNPRQPPKRSQRSNSRLPSKDPVWDEQVVRRGHQNEDSEDYCYAYSSTVDREPEVRSGPIPQRSVSLTEDYSQPQDRLSQSALSSSAGSQDYTEPYQSHTQVPLDPGGVYALAKDVPTPELTRVGSRDQYSHLESTTQTLQDTSLHHADESYDHLNMWSNKKVSTKSTSSGPGSGPTSPHRKGSNTSDEVFGTAMTNINKFQSNKYEDLPPNYEEPWDSQERQRKFSLLLEKAEKKDEKRQSVDNTPSQVNPSSNKAARTNNAVGVRSGVNLADNSAISDSSVYEMAWSNQQSHANSDMDDGTYKEPSSFISPAVTSPVRPHHRQIVSNYEDAWDTPQKQKEFKEKLAQARKQRTSQGQVQCEEIFTQRSRTSDMDRAPEEKYPIQNTQSPNISPIRRRTRTEQENMNIERSESCRSLGALAEKIDKSIPLEDQNFFHGTIKRSNAERMLNVFKEGSYLIRRSETSKKDFSLTLKGKNNLPMHMKIVCRPDGLYVLGENSAPFYTIPEMVDYYTSHELPVQNAERICLLYPIPC